MKYVKKQMKVTFCSLQQIINFLFLDKTIKILCQESQVCSYYWVPDLMCEATPFIRESKHCFLSWCLSYQLLEIKPSYFFEAFLKNLSTRLCPQDWLLCDPTELLAEKRKFYPFNIHSNVVK